MDIIIGICYLSENLNGKANIIKLLADIKKKDYFREVKKLE